MKSLTRLLILFCLPLLATSQVKEISYADYNCDNVQTVEDNCSHYILVTGFNFLGDSYYPGETIKLCGSSGSTFLGSNIGYLKIIFSDASSLKIEFNHSRYGEMVLILNRNTNMAMINPKYEPLQYAKIKLKSVSNKELASQKCSANLKLAREWENTLTRIYGTVEMMNYFNFLMPPNSAVFAKENIDYAEDFLQKVRLNKIGTTTERADLHLTIQEAKERLYIQECRSNGSLANANSYVDSIILYGAVFYPNFNINDHVIKYTEDCIFLYNNLIKDSTLTVESRLEFCDKISSLIDYIIEYEEYITGIGTITLNIDFSSQIKDKVLKDRLNLYLESPTLKYSYNEFFDDRVEDTYNVQLSQFIEDYVNSSSKVEWSHSDTIYIECDRKGKLTIGNKDTSQAMQGNYTIPKLFEIAVPFYDTIIIQPYFSSVGMEFTSKRKKGIYIIEDDIITHTSDKLLGKRLENDQLNNSIKTLINQHKIKGPIKADYELLILNEFAYSRVVLHDKNENTFRMNWLKLSNAKHYIYSIRSTLLDHPYSGDLRLYNMNEVSSLPKLEGMVNDNSKQAFSIYLSKHVGKNVIRPSSAEGQNHKMYLRFIFNKDTSYTVEVQRGCNPEIDSIFEKACENLQVIEAPKLKNGEFCDMIYYHPISGWCN